MPIIRDKHRSMGQEVFSRKAVGSRANCPACHRSAEQGVYDDDNVMIPK
ncbi:MAG: diheme cytochrome c [Nitrospirota bacterium]|nr:diheme cytochrome c [Nitrospirota bacterium]